MSDVPLPDKNVSTSWVMSGPSSFLSITVLLKKSGGSPVFVDFLCQLPTLVSVVRCLQSTTRSVQEIHPEQMTQSSWTSCTINFLTVFLCYDESDSSCQVRSMFILNHCSQVSTVSRGHEDSQ